MSAHQLMQIVFVIFATFGIAFVGYSPRSKAYHSHETKGVFEAIHVPC